MRFAEAWRVALDALRANRLRSGLTMLGVVIGVAAVVVLVAIGTGAKQEVESQVQGLGSNLLLVVPGKVSFGNAPTVSPMSMADVEAVSRVAGGRDRLTATLSSGETVRAGVNSKFTSVLGVLETTPTVFTRALAQGSYVSRSDVDTGRRVAVLGYAVAQKLFGDRDPVGLQMDVAGVRFRVVGVFAKLGQSLGVDRDDEVHIPITAMQRLLGTSRVDALAINAADPGRIDALSTQVVGELTHRHPGTEFSAVTQDQIRAAQGGRRPAPRHHRAVPHRSRPAHHDRRAERAGPRYRGGVPRGCAVPGTGGDHLVGHRARVRRLGRRGHRLRRGTGAAGWPAGSGDRAPDRVRVRTSTAVTSWTLTFTLPAGVVAILFGAGTGTGDLATPVPLP